MSTRTKVPQAFVGNDTFRLDSPQFADLAPSVIVNSNDSHALAGDNGQFVVNVRHKGVRDDHYLLSSGRWSNRNIDRHGSRYVHIAHTKGVRHSSSSSVAIIVDHLNGGDTSGDTGGVGYIRWRYRTIGCIGWRYRTVGCIRWSYRTGPSTVSRRTHRAVIGLL